MTRFNHLYSSQLLILIVDIKTILHWLVRGEYGSNSPWLHLRVFEPYSPLVLHFYTPPSVKSSQLISGLKPILSRYFQNGQFGPDLPIWNFKLVRSAPNCKAFLILIWIYSLFFYLKRFPVVKCDQYVNYKLCDLKTSFIPEIYYGLVSKC